MEEKSNRETLKFDSEDDYKEYDEFSDFISDHTEKIKKKDADYISQFGNELISEIDNKNEIRLENQKKQIKYIKRKSNKYSEKYLLDLHYRDVNDIYNEVKFENRSIFRKLIDLFST